jgi:hypothetical protein
MSEEQTLPITQEDLDKLDHAANTLEKIGGTFNRSMRLVIIAIVIVGTMLGFSFNIQNIQVQIANMQTQTGALLDSTPAPTATP